MREKLVQLARQARERAYAPYSGFAVGAAAQFEGGRIFAGCNVENASSGATRCAEQVAICTGIAEGRRRLEAIALVCDGEVPVWPCGVCRQVIYEFGPEATVIAVTVDGASEEASIRALLPRAFGPEDLQHEQA